MRTLIRPDPRDARGEHETRQLVVMCDGTNANVTGGREDSNVVTLTELFAAHRDPRRIVMYDPGVGNPASLPSAGLWDWLHRRWSRVEGLAQGRGVFENILEGYAFLMRHWQPGDEIFVFGFSRGAFTARSLGGLVNRFGIARMQAESMLTTLLNIYFSAEGPPKDAAVAQVLRLFVPERARKVRIQFVGVWDTVEAVGVPPFRMRISATRTLAGKRFVHVRQALALDEARRMFAPRIYEQAERDFETGFGVAGTVEQAWFRGAHADVGGQVPRDESGLSCAPFHWLVSEAVKCGLILEAGGVPLDREDRVERAVCALPSRSPSGQGESWGGRAVLHDTLRTGALWALAGLAPRDTRLPGVVVDGGQRESTSASGERQADGDVPDATARRPAMFEHESVGRLFTRVPTHWQARAGGDHARRAIPLLVAVVVGILAFAATGHALTTGRGDAPVAQLWAYLATAFDANVALQRWQLLGPWSAACCTVGSGLASAAVDLRAVPAALLWDLVLITCWAYLGARMVSWAYGRCIGQRRIGQAPSRLWSMLGLALPLAVVSDLAENAMTWLTTSMLRGGMDILPLFTGPLMALCSAAKWAGLAGVAVLWIVALRRRPAVPARVSRAMLRGDAAGVASAAVGFVSDGKSLDIDLATLDSPPPGQRVVQGDDGFEQPPWAIKRGDGGLAD